MAIPFAQTNRKLALERELEGVRDEVEYDLLPVRAIDVDRFGKRWTVHDELHPGRFDQRLERPGESGGEDGQVCRLERGPEATRLDARKVEQAVDEAQEPERASVNCLEVLSVEGSAGERILDRSEDQREWRAKLMADVAEERGLRAVELGECLRALSLLLVSAGVGHGGRDVAGHEIEEAPVVIVEGAPWADPEHQHPGGLLEARACDRNKHGLACRLIPRFPRETVEAGGEILDHLGASVCDDPRKRPTGSVPLRQLHYPWAAKRLGF